MHHDGTGRRDRRGALMGRSPGARALRRAIAASLRPSRIRWATGRRRLLFSAQRRRAAIGMRWARDQRNHTYQYTCVCVCEFAYDRPERWLNNAVGWLPGFAHSQALG